ncbi:MAG TPA: peptide ligase PGM1-related protein, partial [Patescibacteria group bacterium]|nr:peptide ligase PGM1-related protein [Patescibacteria group bacterium]
IDPAIVDYYLRFVPDPDGARARLSLVALDDADIRPLSQKLLSRPDVVGRVRELAGDPGRASILPFNVGPTDQALADVLGLPLFGPTADLAWLGSKSGARQAARRAGVAVLDGAEDLFSVAAVHEAIVRIRRDRPDAEAVVIKLNHGFSGQGNAIVNVDDLDANALSDSPTTFCAAGESWPSFAAKIEAEGAIVEELIRRPGMTSPSAQLRITREAGRLEVLSTHDQVLGGPSQQVYLGCRFPAHPAYRHQIRDEALKVGRVLADEGVIGYFGIDFLAVPDGDVGTQIYLSEINLRAGGTTHPFWMARLATGATYDDDAGKLLAAGTAKSYMASDNVKSDALVGVTPARMIDVIDRSGLAFDPVTGTGATLHLLGALREHGKMGVTCIADGREEADDLYKRVVDTALALE